jgi:uncharacterized membrane protein
MIDERLRVVSIGLAVAGIAVAGYLTYVHFAEIKAVCVGGGDGCARVQASDQSRLLGVPVALLGLAAYVVLCAANLARGETARMVAAVTALAGFGFSAYLTREAVVDIGATCQWCLLSFGIMTVLAGLAVARLMTAPLEVPA